ncbi:LamG-like jellyroll fold domain-containing protein [Micromonospora sp. URMC 106]|uniref:LamG-like jellyroll fold domain-containing protein n=1 Tax=Micromonospora sp. URMC 106 TaxID=3423408 RepID=UPI003F1A20AD
MAEVPQAAAAASMAAECERRVEVTSRRTETTQVYVNPDGTATVEQYAFPQRARRAGGGWTALDATLSVAADGTVRPAASAVDVTFSGGGSTEFVRVRRDGGEVALSWPGSLPKPRLDGARATYAEALPGVDLVATARGTGFSFVLVVKDRAAAANPALRRLALGSRLTGLRWQGTRVVDAAGRAVLTATAPRMWDAGGAAVGASAGDPAAGGAPAGASAADRAASGAAVDGPREGARDAAVGLTVSSAGKVVLAPDAGLLRDPEATFPLVVDPTIGYAAWTMINLNSPDQSYWSYDKWNCSGPYSTECAKVGYYNPVTYRSMFQFPTAAWQGKQILEGDLAPDFTIDLLHSASCTDSWTELRVVRATLNADTDWYNTAGAFEGHNGAAARNSSCGSVRKGSEFPLTAATLRHAEHHGWVTFGLIAADEGSSAGWKKFDATTARLIVNLNSYPDTPANLTVDGRPCATGPARPYVPTASPTVRAYVSDADGNTLRTVVKRKRIRPDASQGPESETAQDGVPSGTTAQVTLPAGVLDQGDEFVATADWTRDGVPDVLGRDGDGYLYVWPGLSGGTGLQSRRQIGSGWHGWAWQIAGVADWDGDGFLDVVVRYNPSGELFMYAGADTASGFSDARFPLGGGWQDFTYAGLADWDRDGHLDVIASDSGGVMWVYPGESRRGQATQERASIGTGWFGYTYFGTPDWDRDGRSDVVARDPSSGQLWLYPGSGGRSHSDAGRAQIGSGWWNYRALTTPDVDGNGTTDIVAAPPDTTTWTMYPGLGQRGGEGGARWTVAARGLSHGGTYLYRAYASDGRVSGADSGVCEFTVDTVKPAPATVTADVYKPGAGACDGGPCGSVGQTGRFTFASSPDVTSYRWGFNDSPTTVATPAALGGPVTVHWTPTWGGARTLYVDAVDRAGNESRRTYQFVVAAPAGPVAAWKLADDAGATVLADGTGNGRGLTVAGGAVLGAPGRLAPGNDGASRSALLLDGVDDHAARADFLDTSRSFSVSAWVKLGAKGTGDQTVVAQAGGAGQYSAFHLRYLATEDRWAFLTPSGPADPAAWWSVRSTSAPRVGVWTHLTGTYLADAKELRLYVDGVEEGLTTGATTWDGNGQFLVGRSGTGAPYHGAVADVRVWNRLITTSEVVELVDPLTTGRVGEWHFEQVGEGPAYDSSEFAHDLNFHGGMQIPASGAGHTGTGLRLDGIDDHATTDRQVLRTDQSFTVSAWVRPSDSAVSQTFVSQRSAGAYPGFYLHYGAANGGEWLFAMQASATDAAHGTYATTPATNPTGWHHLVGVFDAQRRQLRLYVDGAARATAAMNPAWQPWDATGPLVIGTSGSGTFVRGDVDEVRAFQGAVPDPTRLFHGTDTLTTGQRLTAGQYLWSRLDNHRLIMQGDGNLVQYDKGVAVWASNTQGNPGAFVQMQTDGNLVIYRADGAALWSTRTHGTDARLLAVQNDGNLVLYALDGRVIWAK